VTLPQIVQQICDSLVNAVPELVLRLKALADDNAKPQPEILRSVEGVAKASDSLAATCTDVANEEYEEYPEIKEDILSSATLVTKSSVKLRRATIMLNQKQTGDRAPAYNDVMEAATAIAAACVHVLEVVYGSYLRRCVAACDDACGAMDQNTTATESAAVDAQHYADTVGDLCTRANNLASALYALGDNDRDAEARSKFSDMGSRVEQASTAFLNAANDYIEDLENTGKRDAAQKKQEELVKVLKEARDLIVAHKKETEKKETPAEPEPQPVEEVAIPTRPSLASQMKPIEVPLTYLMMVAEQKRQCDLVDDLVATAKAQMRQAMVEDGKALVQRHSIITQEAERLCECDMARAAVDDTAEKSDTAIRTLIKNGSQTLDNPEDEEMKKTLVASASEYKVLLMKYSDDCILKPQEGRTLTACQRLRIAVTEVHASEEILSLLEEAVREYDYRVERVQDDELKEELLEYVRIIEVDVRSFAAKNGVNADEERDTALDSMDRFENAIIAYLLTLVQAALVETSKLFVAISKKDDSGLDSCTRTVVSSISEVITESRGIADEYTGCVEGTQDEFDAASKRVDDALPEMLKVARAVKAGRTEPQETLPQQKELEDSLHHVEELCKRAQYKRVPKKHEPEPPKVEEKKPEPPKEEEKKPEPESVIVERKKTEEKVEKVEKVEKKEKTETTVEKKEDSGFGGINMLLVIVIIVLLIIIVFRLV